MHDEGSQGRNERRVIIMAKPWDTWERVDMSENRHVSRDEGEK